MISPRHRVTVGLCLIGTAVVVAFMGYLGVSAETDVAFQLPYFASAGIGALLLMGGGATMLLGAQLEADDERLSQIEDAVRSLADEVARIADETPRGRSLRAVSGERAPKA